jgi:hypothetical protein
MARGAVTGATIKVEGLAEVNAAFKEYGTLVHKDLGADLKEAAQPVVDTAKEREKWQGASIPTIRSRRYGLNVWVEQSARKVTGRRGDYGALQMRDALIPALDQHTAEIEAKTDAALDKYALLAGFA